jgi:DNA anti-recombination protein RmuC
MPGSGEIIDGAVGAFATVPGVTQFFLLFILLEAVYFHIHYNRQTTSVGPTILTMTGILATFVGVAIGLYRFDTTNVQASIPSLLGGLKTAFWASAFGVFCAITLKAREHSVGRHAPSDQPQASDDVTAADLVRHLREIREALNGDGDRSVLSQVTLARRDMNERLAPLREIHRGLVGSEDGSLMTQLRLLRQDSKDGLDMLRKDIADGFGALRTAMAEALHKLSEVGSATLIEALRDVIRDFNEKLTEQFGENFKELNAAVGRLLVWQENYRITIEATVARLDEVVALIGKVSEDFRLLVERSGKFTQVAESLGSLLTALEAGERRLREVAEGLATLLVKASGSLPEIERKVQELTAQMADAVRENQRIVSASLAESATAIRETAEALRQDVATVTAQLSASVIESQRVVDKGLTDSAAAIQASIRSVQQEMTQANSELGRQLAGVIRDNQQNVGAALTAGQQLLEKTLVDNAAAIRTSIQTSQQEMANTNRDFNRQLSELATKTKEQVATLDAALAAELTKSLESLAKQFSALSNRFANDYGPLADKLREIVRIAERVG